MLVTLDFCQTEGDEHQNQTEHVAEIMSRIAEEREGILPKAHAGLDKDEKSVEDYRKDEYAA